MDGFHVDLVCNDLDSMVRRIVGRAVLVHDTVKVDTFDADFNYEPMLNHVLKSETEMTGVFGAELLRSLPGRIDSGYLFATEPHDDDACDFRTVDIIPIEVERSEPIRLFD